MIRMNQHKRRGNSLSDIRSFCFFFETRALYRFRKDAVPSIILLMFAEAIVQQISL